MGDLILEPALQKKTVVVYLKGSRVYNGVHTFPDGISSKMNVIAWRCRSSNSLIRK